MGHNDFNSSAKQSQEHIISERRLLGQHVYVLVLFRAIQARAGKKFDSRSQCLKRNLGVRGEMLP
jgi:hypothetical protein